MNEFRDHWNYTTAENQQSAQGENGMVENELKFPQWQEPLREAILEPDPKQLAAKTQRIEALIRERLQELRMSDPDPDSPLRVEEQALLDALNVIRIVLKDKPN